VVVLNGASSTGKTTIATAFRDQRAAAGDFWLLTGIDDALAKLTAEWTTVGSVHGEFEARGVRFESTSEGTTVHVGDVGRQLLRVYRQAVGAAARLGLNVVVDEVLTDQTSWEDWSGPLEGIDVVWVGVRCSPEAAQRRERARGDRYAGLSRAQSAVVHTFTNYDFELDTTTRAPSESVAALATRLGY
jgi:chloramphenicol 3-O phosphotransferase